MLLSSRAACLAVSLDSCIRMANHTFGNLGSALPQLLTVASVHVLEGPACEDRIEVDHGIVLDMNGI
jgi:hypothetical protein